MKTFEDYIVWLRKNGYFKEAEFYRKEVFKTLKMLGLSDKEIQNMSTDKVVENLQLILDTLNKQVRNLSRKSNDWDVEIRNGS